MKSHKLQALKDARENVLEGKGAIMMHNI